MRFMVGFLLKYLPENAEFSHIDDESAKRALTDFHSTR